MLDLATLGWDDGWNATFEPYRADGLLPGRVAVQHRGAYDVLTREGEQRAKITSRLRRASDRTAMPVVGDWVALDGAGSIVDVVPRRTTISRRAAHEPASGVSREQVIAANVDVVLVVQALGQELDRRLLERYLALACRFSDCKHETEPGCAVRAALASGELSRDRWERYKALERELAELAERLERRERSRVRRRPTAES